MGARSEEDVEQLFESLGFRLSQLAKGSLLQVSVPSQEEATSKTLAQMLVERSKLDLRNEIKRQETMAVNFWKDIERNLEEGLKSERLQTYYTVPRNTFDIYVVVSVPEKEKAQSYKAYDDKLRELVSENGFDSINIDSDTEVMLEIKDPAYEADEEVKPAETDKAEATE